MELKLTTTDELDKFFEQVVDMYIDDMMDHIVKSDASVETKNLVLDVRMETQLVLQLFHKGIVSYLKEKE